MYHDKYMEKPDHDKCTGITGINVCASHVIYSTFRIAKKCDWTQLLSTRIGKSANVAIKFIAVVAVELLTRLHNFFPISLMFDLRFNSS